MGAAWPGKPRRNTGMSTWMSAGAPRSSAPGKRRREVIDPLLAQGKDVLIVGHGAMNLSFISQVRRLPRKDFWTTGIENCKMIRLV